MPRDVLKILGREVDIVRLDDAVKAYRYARGKRRENPDSLTAAANEANAVARIIETVDKRYVP